MTEKLLANRAKCLICGDVIESLHLHNFVRCSCGNLFVDGGLDYARRGWLEDRWEELSVYDTGAYEED